MKKYYKFMVTAFLAFLYFTNSPAFAQEDKKLYVFFKDIGTVVNQDGVIINEGNGEEQIYFDPLLTHAGFFIKNLEKTSYPAFFSSGKNLTDYEVAIFYMGDEPLQWDGGTGHSVVSEIKKMLDAGKRVILIGNALLFWAYNQGSTQRIPLVQQFFKDYLGIDQNAYLGSINTTSGSTYKPFGIKAMQGDPVSLGYRKICNLKIGENTVEPLHPWRYRPWVDAIDGKKLDSNTVPMEFFTWVADPTEINTIPNTEIYMGVRREMPSSDPQQPAKIVFWTSGFEVAAASSFMPYWQEEMWYALHWCSVDLPKPGPNIVFGVNPLEMGTVAISDSSVKELKIMNTGRDPLEIYDYYFFADDGYFSLPTPPKDRHMVIKPNESAYVKVVFKPAEEEKYEDQLYFESNAANGNSLGVDVDGYGGKKPEPGPRICVESKVIDFGVVKPNQVDTSEIVISNCGIDLLMISKKFYWPKEGFGSFQYVQNTTWPFSMYPGDTIRVPYKFVPHQITGMFYDTLGIITDNAVNYPPTDTLWIYFQGECKGDEKAEGISFSTSAVEFDTTELDQYAFKEITIENTGNKLLYLKIRMDNEQGGIFELYKEDEISPIPGIWELGIAGSTKKRKVLVQFHPTAEGVYTGTLLIDVYPDVDANTPIDSMHTEISVKGITHITDVQDASIENAIFTMKAVPNPVLGESILHYSLKTASPENVEMFVVDLSGNKVMDIFSGKINPGDYTTKLNLEKFSSGTYYIMAVTNGHRLKLPVVLMK